MHLLHADAIFKFIYVHITFSDIFIACAQVLAWIMLNNVYNYRKYILISACSFHRNSICTLTIFIVYCLKLQVLFTVKINAWLHNVRFPRFSGVIPSWFGRFCIFTIKMPVQFQIERNVPICCKFIWIFNQNEEKIVFFLCQSKLSHRSIALIIVSFTKIFIQFHQINIKFISFFHQLNQFFLYLVYECCAFAKNVLPARKRLVRSKKNANAQRLSSKSHAKLESVK